MFKRIIVNAIDKVCDLELKYITSDKLRKNNIFFYEKKRFLISKGDVTMFGKKKKDVYLNSIEELVKLQGLMEERHSAFIDRRISSFELYIEMRKPFQFYYNSKGELEFSIES